MIFRWKLPQRIAVAIFVANFTLSWHVLPGSALEYNEKKIYGLLIKNADSKTEELLISGAKAFKRKYGTKIAIYSDYKDIHDTQSLQSLVLYDNDLEVATAFVNKNQNLRITYINNLAFSTRAQSVFVNMAQFYKLNEIFSEYIDNKVKLARLHTQNDATKNAVPIGYLNLFQIRFDRLVCSSFNQARNDYLIANSNSASSSTRVPWRPGIYNFGLESGGIDYNQAYKNQIKIIQQEVFRGQSLIKLATHKGGSQRCCPKKGADRDCHDCTPGVNEYPRD